MDAEKYIAEMLENSKEDIRKQVMEQLKKDIIGSICYNARDLLANEAKDFVSEHIAPEVKKILINNKGVFLEEIEKGIVQVGANVSRAMLEAAMQNLEVGGYRAKEIIRKIFE